MENKIKKEQKMQGKDLRAWSYSKIKCYNDCLHSFYLRYIKKVKVMPNEAMINGSKRHAIFEKLIKNEDIKNIDDIDLKAFKRVESLVRGFKTETYLCIDEQGNICKDKNMAFYLGIIDAHNERNSFVDWKTGASLMCDKEQLDSYFILLSAWYKVSEIITGSFIFPYQEENEENEEKPPARTFTYYTKEVTSFFNILKKKILKIEDDLDFLLQSKDLETAFEPNFESCKNCIVWNYCKYFNKAIVEENEETKEILKYPVLKNPDGTLNVKNIREAILFVESVKMLLKKAESQLKTVIKKQVILEDGRSYGHFKKEQNSVKDVRNFIKTIHNMGYNKDEYWKLLTLSPTNLKKVCKKLDLNPDDFLIKKEIKKFDFLKQ